MAGVLLVFVFGFGFCYDLGHSSFGVSSPVYYASFKALGSTVMTFPFIATLAFLLKKQQLKKIGKSEINILQTSLKISTLIYVIFFFGFPQVLAGYVLIPITIVAVIGYFIM